MFAGFTLFGADFGTVVTGNESRPAVLGLDLIMRHPVTIDTLLNQFIAVFDFAFRISGAGIAAGAVIGIIGAALGRIRFGSGGAGIGIIGIFEFAGAGNILAANRIFIVALSAGTESGKFSFYETVGADTGGKEHGIIRAVGIRGGNFIAFTISQRISGTVSAFKGHAFFTPVREEINFGNLHRLWPFGCVNVKRERSR